jgi:sorting nexin-7/30/sorting nexin-8
MSNSPNLNELEQKTEILKKEILEKNHDQNAFINFCLSKKENGDDLNNWNLQELKKIIEEFTLTQKEKENKTNEYQKNINAENIVNSMEKIDTSHLKVGEKKSIKTIIIQCKKLEKTILNDKKVNIIIRNPIAKQSTNILKSGYIIYEVYTEETNWSVQRRYSDFDWLRNILIKFYPFKLVAPIPGKKIGTRRFDVDFIEKRMDFLQKFIDTIIQDENFKACEPMIAFLSMKERTQFESKMKELSSYLPSKYIEDFRTFNCQVEISTEQSNDNGEMNDSKNPTENYYTNIKSYFKLQTNLLERLNYNLKNFYKNMKVCCKNLEDVQKDFDMINQLNEKIFMREPIKKTYEEFGIFIKNWKRILFNQNEQIKESIKNFFKFVKLEGSAFLDMINRREEIRDKYIQDSNTLRTKKEKLWIENNIKKWDIIDDYNQVDNVLLIKDKKYALSKMCTQDTLAVEKLKEQLGYANKMISNELKKFLNENSEKFMENMKDFVQKFYPSLTDGISVWTTLANYC